MPVCKEHKPLKSFVVSYYLKSRYDNEIKYLELMAYTLRQAIWKFHTFHKDYDLVAITEKI